MSDKQKRDLLKAHEEDIENYANDLFVFSQKIRNVKVSLSPERFGKLLEYDNLEPDSWNHSTGEIEWDNGYFFQSAILKVPKKKLEMIIRNFELAIQTNMNNPDINLSGITFELPESFQWWELDTLIQLKFRMNQIQTIYNDICMASGHENIFNHNQLNHSKKLEQSDKTSKFKAKENALAYILDLYANGEQIPINPTEGSYDKKELILIGSKRYKKDKGDTFYRAVLDVAKYDLNIKKHLESISKRWLSVCMQLSSDKTKLESYLKGKNLM